MEICYSEQAFSTGQEIQDITRCSRKLRVSLLQQKYCRITNADEEHEKIIAVTGKFVPFYLMQIGVGRVLKSISYWQP